MTELKIWKDRDGVGIIASKSEMILSHDAFDELVVSLVELRNQTLEDEHDTIAREIMLDLEEEQE